MFADIGLENADELLVRADLIIAIQREIERRGLSKKQASDLIGLTELDVSKIVRADIDPVTQGQLVTAAGRLGLDVDVIARGSKAALTA